MKKWIAIILAAFATQAAVTAQNVMVQWDDGDIYTYPINRMTVIEQSGVRM